MTHDPRSPWSSSTRTVRELGGEIWAELRTAELAQQIDWQVRGAFVELVMGLLARHAGKRLENDSDLPVTPLPRSQT
jgi:hypothetical protein